MLVSGRVLPKTYIIGIALKSNAISSDFFQQKLIDQRVDDSYSTGYLGADSYREAGRADSGLFLLILGRIASEE